MKTQRMKSKDRHLGVLNMPEATEVVLRRKSLKNAGYYISTILVSLSGGRGEEVEAEQEKEEIANHLSQDHCKQDLFHHQPSDEGRIQNWRKLSAGSFFFFPQVENPLNRLVILAKHGSMMLAGDCHFIQVPSQSSEMK